MSKEIINVNDGIFTEAEQELLELTKKARVDIIKDMTRNGSPTGARDIEVLVMTATSLDKQVNDAANSRLKHSDNNNIETTLNIVAEALKVVAKANMTEVTQLAELPIELDVDDFAPGENVIEAEVLSVDDFIPNKD